MRLCVAAAVSPLTDTQIMDARGKPAPAGTILDHLLLGAANLDSGVEWAEKLTGVRAVPGGSHPGAGTRNALISLGGRQYLEIIAPDPPQPSANLVRHAHLRALTGPRLIGWAAASDDLDRLAQAIRDGRLEMSGPRDGSRARPDGRVLRWRTLAVSSPLGGGEADPIPFFIQWASGSVHPSEDSPHGCRLDALEFRHPDPDALQGTLLRLGIEAAVTRAPAAQLAATLVTPKGRVVVT
jgi:Glyoxalase-like domain